MEGMELAFRRPDDVLKIPAHDRAHLVKENNDLCVMEGKRFFIRAVLPLPVESREHPYCIGLWVELNELAFQRIYDLWESEEQVSEAPFHAVIANEIPAVAGSFGLEAELRLTGPATRPTVHLKPSPHQLYTEQFAGIDIHRIYEYTAVFAARKA